MTNGVRTQVAGTHGSVVSLNEGASICRMDCDNREY